MRYPSKYIRALLLQKVTVLLQKLLLQKYCPNRMRYPSKYIRALLLQKVTVLLQKLLLQKYCPNRMRYPSKYIRALSSALKIGWLTATTDDSRSLLPCK